MFEFIANSYQLTVSKTGKYMFKALEEKYFNVVVFIIDKPAFDTLKQYEGRTFTIRCFKSFNSNFGNLVKVIDTETGEILYEV